MGQEPCPEAGQSSPGELWSLLKEFSLYSVQQRRFPPLLNCRYCSVAILRRLRYIAVFQEEKWRMTFLFEAIRGDSARQDVITLAGARPREKICGSPSARLFSALEMRDCTEHVKINETNLVSVWTSPPSRPHQTQITQQDGLPWTALPRLSLQAAGDREPFPFIQVSCKVGNENAIVFQHRQNRLFRQINSACDSSSYNRNCGPNPVKHFSMCLTGNL